VHMTSVEIELDSAEVEDLARSFRNGPMLNDRGPRLLEEQTVASIDGLRVVIFADEHPPPHFRVEFQGESASFAITDCERLRGNKGLEKYERNIKSWWRENRLFLIEKWNAFRPTDCTVGPVRQ
jgi:hypothetical protein